MSNVIDYFEYNNPFLKVKTYFSLRARKKMYQRFINDCKPAEEDHILDIGATPDTKLADSNFFEKMYPYKGNITVASIEDCQALVRQFGLKRYVYNAPHQPFPFADKEFDIVFSSAVLEHVGNREDQRLFVEECLRVGKKVFLTTPNRYFPVEMHTFMPLIHWLPWKCFQWLVKPIRGGFWADINNLNLLSQRDIKKMISDRVIIEKVKTLGFTSNLILVKK
jgi:SAM-dependent methyltransferase